MGEHVPVRLATWNVNSVVARLPRLLAWLDAARPDVLCLQETKCPGESFPRHDVAELGYQTLAHGDGRWNGVAVLSRVGLERTRLGLADQPAYSAPASTDEALFETRAEPVVEARAAAASCGPLRVLTVYVPNGRSLDSPHFAYKLEWLRALVGDVAKELAGGGPFVLCGDFNVAPTDADVWDPAAFVGSTHVTPAERELLGQLRELGLTDVVPRPLKYDRPFTYWDYRAGMFPNNKGMRIDLVLADAGAAAAVTDAYIDREVRKGKSPSDHAPVVVDLDI
jgi:exodeoxyribonuclease-3